MRRITALSCALLLLPGAGLAQKSNNNSSPAFNLPIPNIPGKSIEALVVDYPPGGGTPAHRHAHSAFITAMSCPARSEAKWMAGRCAFTMRENILRKVRALIIRSVKMPAKPSRQDCWPSLCWIRVKRR